MGIALDSSFKLYSSVLRADNKTFGNLIISTFPFENARVLAVLLYLQVKITVCPYLVSYLE